MNQKNNLLFLFESIFLIDKSVLDKSIKFCYILLKRRGEKMHQVYELETTITEQGTIKLPRELSHLKNRKVKISLVLVDEQDSDTQNWLDLIESHAIDDDELPTDYSINLDHYLYGLPKRKIEKE